MKPVILHSLFLKYRPLKLFKELPLNNWKTSKKED